MWDALLLTAWVSCQGADLGTTVPLLRQPGYVEANPVMRGPHLIPLKIGINVGVWIWQRNRSTRDKRTAAVIMAGFGCIPAALNARHLRKR